MTITQDRIKLVRAYTELNGSFGADQSASIASFMDVPFDEFQIENLDHDMQEPNSLQQHIDDMSKAVPGIKGWQATGRIALTTFDTRAGNGASAVQGPLGRLLRAIFGVQRLGDGDLVNDGSPAVGAFDMTTIAEFAAGSAIGFVLPSAGYLEAREIASISGSTLSPKHNFSEAPANGQNIFNSATYYLGAGTSDVTTTTQFAVYGLEPQDRWLLCGGYPTSISFELGPQIIPRMSVTYAGPLWVKGESAAAPLSGALPYASYTNHVHHVVKDSYFRVSGVGVQSLSNTLVNAPTINIECNISYVPPRTPSGVETYTQPVRSHEPPVARVTWREPLEDYTRRNAVGASTDYSVHYQIGSSPTDGCILITLPTVQVKRQALVSESGLRYQETMAEARCDDGTTEGSPTDLGLSAMRIHLL